MPRPSPSSWRRWCSFAERAYRRPLTANERADLLAYYKKLRTKNAAQP